MTAPRDAMPTDLPSALQEIEHLRRAVESHETVGKAIGVLMGLHRMSDHAAFAALTRVSMHHNIKVRDVAEAVLIIVSSDTVVSNLLAASAALELLPQRHNR